MIFCNNFSTSCGVFGLIKVYLCFGSLFGIEFPLPWDIIFRFRSSNDMTEILYICIFIAVSVHYSTQFICILLNFTGNSLNPLGSTQLIDFLQHKLYRFSLLSTDVRYSLFVRVPLDVDITGHINVVVNNSVVSDITRHS